MINKVPKKRTVSPIIVTRPVAQTGIRNSNATLSLILSILAVVTIWNPIGFVLGILAIIFAVLGIRNKTNGMGAAVTGITLGIICVVGSICFSIFEIILYKVSF